MTVGEVTKAHERRVRERWFECYCPEWFSGIDIGCQTDPINETFRRWDIVYGDGDATYMAGVSDNKFHTVHVSHVLEHLADPVTAIQNWYRILSPGGNLIILVPHRDLYERKPEPPSMWNHEHKTFWLPEESAPPSTLSLKGTIIQAIPDANIISFRVLDFGHDWNQPKDNHPIGEYSIEAIVNKPN